MNSEELLSKHPEVILLDTLDSAGLQTYLRKRGLLGNAEEISSAEKPGEGNMNYTLRISTTEGRSFILKQSRPWVEKYPQIPAPWDRAIREARFYDLVKAHPKVANGMPRLLDLDPILRVLAVEDLGHASDFTNIYSPKNPLINDDLAALCEWLSALHEIEFNEEARSSLVNRDMRELNHEHIFNFPLLKNNGLDLDGITPGLKKEAARLIDDQSFVATVRQLGEVYQQDGKTLLHGDYFPGSWLKTPNGVRIIDPEFGFFGPAEFDAGVILAHLHLSNQDANQISFFYKSYQPQKEFDPALMQAFAGVEIMRRLIGIAQLPLPCDLQNKAALLEIAHNLVMNFN